MSISSGDGETARDADEETGEEPQTDGADPQGSTEEPTTQTGGMRGITSGGGETATSADDGEQTDADTGTDTTTSTGGWRGITSGGGDSATRPSDTRDTSGTRDRTPTGGGITSGGSDSATEAPATGESGSNGAASPPPSDVGAGVTSGDGDTTQDQPDAGQPTNINADTREIAREAAVERSNRAADETRQQIEDLERRREQFAGDRPQRSAESSPNDRVRDAAQDLEQEVIETTEWADNPTDVAVVREGDRLVARPSQLKAREIRSQFDDAIQAGEEQLDAVQAWRAGLAVGGASTIDGGPGGGAPPGRDALTFGPGGDVSSIDDLSGSRRPVNPALVDPPSDQPAGRGLTGGERGVDGTGEGVASSVGTFTTPGDRSTQESVVQGGGEIQRRDLGDTPVYIPEEVAGQDIPDRVAGVPLAGNRLENVLSRSAQGTREFAATGAEVLGPFVTPMTPVERARRFADADSVRDLVTAEETRREQATERFLAGGTGEVAALPFTAASVSKEGAESAAFVAGVTDDATSGPTDRGQTALLQTGVLASETLRGIQEDPAGSAGAVVFTGPVAAELSPLRFRKVDVPEAGGQTTRVRALRAETPRAFDRYSTRRGRTLVSTRGARPTVGTPEFTARDIDFQRAGGEMAFGPEFEPRGALETDIARTIARAEGGEAATRFEAVDRLTQIGATRRQRRGLEVESTEEILQTARAVPEERAGELADVLAQNEGTTIFGSAAVRAQVPDARRPRDVDIAVENPESVRGQLANALEGANADVGDVFDIKPAQSIAGRGETVKFGRGGRQFLETDEGVQINPAEQELMQKAGAAGFLRGREAPAEEFIGVTDEFDVGPQPARPGERPRFKDPADASAIARDLLQQDLEGTSRLRVLRRRRLQQQSAALAEFEAAFGEEIAAATRGPDTDLPILPQTRERQRGIRELLADERGQADFGTRSGRRFSERVANADNDLRRAESDVRRAGESSSPRPRSNVRSSSVFAPSVTAGSGVGSGAAEGDSTTGSGVGGAPSGGMSGLGTGRDGGSRVGAAGPPGVSSITNTQSPPDTPDIPRLGTPYILDTPDIPDIPDTPTTPDTPGIPNIPTTPGGGRPRDSGEDQGATQREREPFESFGQPNARDEQLFPGWLSETVFTAATLGTETPRAPSQQTLEAQPFKAFGTGEFPVAQQLDESESAERVAAVQDLLGGADGFEIADGADGTARMLDFRGERP